MISNDDRGTAAVEFALILPFLLLLLFGVIDFGRAYFVTSTLSHAAREGVRVIALGQDAGTAKARAVSASVGVDSPTAEVRVGGLAAADDYTCTFGEPTVMVVTAPFQYGSPLGALVAAFGGTGSGYGGTQLAGRASMRCGG